MLFTKGTPKPANSGRKKGTPNKSTVEARDAIIQAADRLGGVDRLVEWAKEDPANERLFWGTLYPKLIPNTHAGDPANPVRIEGIVRFVSSQGT